MIPGPAAITAEVLAAGARPVLSHSDRRTPCPGYVTDFKNWLPVMESHEGSAPGYLGTPAVTLLAMLHAALGELAAEPMPARVARHAWIAGAFKAGIAALGLSLGSRGCW